MLPDRADLRINLRTIVGITIHQRVPIRVVDICRTIWHIMSKQTPNLTPCHHRGTRILLFQDDVVEAL